MASTPELAIRAAEQCLEVTQRESSTIDDAIDEYRQYLSRVRGNKERSCTATVARLRLFFTSRRLLVRELTASRCEQIYGRLTNTVSAKTGQPLRPDTHRNYLAEAKSFLGWCVSTNKLRANPLAGVKGIGRRSHGKEQLTADEARRWLAVAKSLFGTEPGAVAAALLLLCGMRCSEVTERLVRDVDERGTVLRITTGKTRASARPVAIPSVIRESVVALCQGKEARARLFGRHSRDWPRHWVKRICELAKVPVVCAHSMRGLHATLSVAAGISPHVVAASLGHESASTTLQSYAVPGTAEAAASRVAQEKLDPTSTRH